MNDLSKIAKRHHDIPQDALPIDFPTADLGGGEGVKERPLKSVRWAKCPSHVPGGKNQLTGLVHDGNQLVFRDHTKKVGKQTVPCPGSGQPWAGDTREGPA